MESFMEKDKCEWEGDNGDSYEYNIYTIDEIKENPDIFMDNSLHSLLRDSNVKGNYIFAKLNPFSHILWTPVYIGEGILKNRTNLNKRQDNVDCIEKYGATHVHFHTHNRDNEANRLKEEKDLNDKHQPPCKG